MSDSWDNDSDDYDEWEEETKIEPFPTARNRYGLGAKFFHWSIALLIFGLILVGFYMKGLPYSPDKLQIYGLHKSFGLMVLWLASVRIVWRQFVKPPLALDTHKNWEKILAKITHIFLYIAMIGMPLTGWLMSSAGEYPCLLYTSPSPRDRG